ncbi:hypothetical protein [Actinomadura sp. DC4]|uniref:hypothetical protein n=1 Tax=Actinomadura sp. DC4 TaxID=3055069 RepID=UPI0025B095FD|nr:hypothetical protein [Actinomadura sp. DC4]MDN3357712.1 hypothetical protein [Actinomadura sp. DC4]
MNPRTTAFAQATVVVLLTVLGLLGAGAGPAAAADAPWTVSTASNDFGSGRANYAYTLDPGGELKDGLVIANHGTAPLHLAVYAADGFTTKAGRLDLVAEGARSAKVGAWVRPARPDVTVEPGGTAEVPFTVALPGDAVAGEYMGGIVTSPVRAGEAGGRLGIRIRLRVGGDLRPALSVTDPRVRYSGTPNPFGKGDATVAYTIRNTGNAILTARQAVSVSGPFGRLRLRAGKVADSPPLLPGDTWKVSVPVHGVTRAVRLTATVTLTPLITDAAGSTAPLTGVTATAHHWTAPWALLLVLVALCATAVAVLRRRRRTGEPQPEDAEKERNSASASSV